MYFVNTPAPRFLLAADDTYLPAHAPPPPRGWIGGLHAPPALPLCADRVDCGGLRHPRRTRGLGIGGDPLLFF